MEVFHLHELLSVSKFLLHLGTPSQRRAEGQGQARLLCQVCQGAGTGGDGGLGHQHGTAARAGVQMGTALLWPCVGTRTC